MTRSGIVSLLLFAVACGGPAIEAPSPAVPTAAVVAAPPRTAEPPAIPAAPPAPPPEAMPSVPAAVAPVPTSRGDEEAVRGAQSGVTGGAVTPAPAPIPRPKGVIPFDPKMGIPKRLSGDFPVYPREARDAHVEGEMTVGCVITVEGAAVDCHVIKSLPFMDKPVLAALQTHRYQPLTFAGRTVAVDYVFKFKFKLQ